jgi:hypothetical protein
VGIVLVLAIAVAVGVLVYRLTAGGEEAAPSTPTAEGDDASWATDPTPAAAKSTPTLEVPEGYIPVAGAGPSWQGRLGGAMGLVIAVAIGAIGLALSLWALVTLVSRAFADL